MWVLHVTQMVSDHSQPPTGSDVHAMLCRHDSSTFTYGQNIGFSGNFVKQFPTPCQANRCITIKDLDIKPPQYNLLQMEARQWIIILAYAIRFFGFVPFNQTVVGVLHELHTHANNNAII